MKVRHQGFECPILVISDRVILVTVILQVRFARFLAASLVSMTLSSTTLSLITSDMSSLINASQSTASVFWMYPILSYPPPIQSMTCSLHDCSLIRICLRFLSSIIATLKIPRSVVALALDYFHYENYILDYICYLCQASLVRTSLEIMHQHSLVAKG